jgi:dTDP-4-amino-4,6-dideoxygalactose transaminase
LGNQFGNSNKCFTHPCWYIVVVGTCGHKLKHMDEFSSENKGQVDRPVIQPTFVTKPFLPPLEELIPSLEKIWESQNLTNGGPFHQQFETELCEYLGVKHISLFTNATIALITALQALDISGEVITTPFSFVATSHSLIWNNIKPVFVDIDEISLNLDPTKIEAAITERTTAILPVHCYGNPCDVEAIDYMAKKYDLKVLYDAAHAFGVNCHCGSILNHGDLSVISFHATKVFNTFEGGAIVSSDAATKSRIDSLKNFGIENEISVTVPGINGKMSEFNAALGCLQLRYIDDVIKQRARIASAYNELLANVEGVEIVGPFAQLRPNYAYFPIRITEGYGLTRDQLYESLKEIGVFTRRYFYPLISSFSMYQNLPSSNLSNLAVADKIANQILCLPIYPALETNTIEIICSHISRY